MSQVNHAADRKGAALCLDEAWHYAAAELWDHAAHATSRDGDIFAELPAARLMLMNTRAVWMMGPRSPSPLYAAGELMWYLSGSEDGEFICHYAPSYERFLNDGVALGAYGPHIRGPLKSVGGFDPLMRIASLLTAKPDTRQAVLPIYGYHDLQAAGSLANDIPCTLGLQFLVRDSSLNVISTMRSNDLWQGLPYDIFAFATINVLLAHHLDLSPGWICHQAGSLHLYERHAEATHRAILSGQDMYARPPKLGWWTRREPGRLFHDLAAAVALERRFREDREVPLAEAISCIQQSLGARTLLGTIVALCYANRRAFNIDEANAMNVVIPDWLIAKVINWQGRQRAWRKS